MLVDRPRVGERRIAARHGDAGPAVPRVDLFCVVLPGGRVVGLLIGPPAREQALEVFWALEVFAQERRGVRVRHDVVAERAVVGEDVVDEAAEKDDVGAGPERDPDIGQ